MKFPDLTDPQPFNGSWAIPGHKPLGVTLTNYDLTREQIETAKSTGCKLIRIVLPMESFFEEAEPDWATLDMVVSRLSRAGFEVMPVLTANAAIPEFFAAFCTNVAKRYGQTFQYYQVLDDINLKIGLYSRDYADLLMVARASLVFADPDAVVVCGGVRGVDLTYFDMLANQGALQFIDVLALNLNPSMDGLEVVDTTERVEHSLPYVRQVVDWAWANNKRVWVTNFGVSTCFGWPGVDQVDQASAYSRGALYLGWAGVDRIIFASLQDSDPAYEVPVACTGLLDASGMPKASFYVLQRLNSTLEGGYHVEPPMEYRGFTYQLPQAVDLMVEPINELVEIDPLAEYMLRDSPVYGFWFYYPESQQYSLIYWLGTDLMYDVRYSVRVLHPGLAALERYILLDAHPAPIESQMVVDTMLMQYLPIETVPGIIRLEVKENGRS